LKSAVLDAGPIIHLSEIGCIQFLQIFDTVYVPNAVYSETAEEADFWNFDASGLMNIHRQALSQDHIERYIRENDLDKLHAGETECLYLCHEKGISILLTHDLAVRETAKRLKITPVGSVGIISQRGQSYTFDKISAI